jgi:hypothetical protein
MVRGGKGKVPKSIGNVADVGGDVAEARESVSPAGRRAGSAAADLDLDRLGHEGTVRTPGAARFGPGRLAGG